MSNYGFVYCMSNDSMPGLFKIGYTTKSPLARAYELSSPTGIPEPFNVLFYIETRNPQDLEQEIHRRLIRYRKNENREFFMVSDEIIHFVFTNVDVPYGMFMESMYYVGLVEERKFMAAKAVEKAKAVEE